VTSLLPAEGEESPVTERSPVPPDAVPAPEPQAVLTPLTANAIFLVLTIEPGGEPAVRDLLSDWTSLARAVGFRAPDAALAAIAAIGSRAWDRLFSGPRPAELHPFRELSGARHRAPATAGDLLFHLRHERMDVCFEFATHALSRLAGAVSVADEVHGFRYFDERDLLGFVDGTENPAGTAAVAAVTIGDEDPAFAGGSYVVVQKYLHDLDAWNALPVEQQELAIGRRKLTDVELPDADKPASSHVALNTITDADGTQRQIMRDNMPFGTVGDRQLGTYFIGYAADPAVVEQMLRNMFVGNPPGTHDRILDFSTAVTGALFFVPTADFLDDPSVAPATAVPDETPTGTSAPDGSLVIGSLRRSGSA
jgi:porphyrinogen peroxidase